MILDVKTVFFRWIVFNSDYKESYSYSYLLNIKTFVLFVLFVSFVVNLHNINMECNHDAV